MKLAAALLLLLTAAASAQPTTRPAAVDWTPATPIVAGGTYYLPRGGGPVAVHVYVPNVTLKGGEVSPKGGTAVYFHRGADAGRVVGTRFDVPDAPALPRVKLTNVGACVRTEADGTDVVGCDFGSVNECVNAMPGSSRLRVMGCRDEKGDIRSAWVYMAGVEGVLISGNTFRDSATENGLRMSPQSMPDGTVAVSSGVVIRDNDLANPGNKMAIDARHVRGVKIEHNRIHQVRGDFGQLVPAVRLGDSSLPGASGVYVHDNDFYGGSLHAKAKSDGIADGNRFHDMDPRRDVAINFDVLSRVIPTYTTAFYVGPLPAKFKPVSSVGGATNAWVNAATTQPTQ